MSKFQQRHYEAIAEVMQDAYDLAVHEDAVSSLHQVQALNRTENLLVDLFKRDNSEFMPSRFRRACVPGANVKARTK